MNERLQELSTREIEAFIRQAQDILADRKTEEDQRRRQEKHASEPEAVPGEGGNWLEHELVNCGNCPRCAGGGRHHGPYWYLYRYTGSRMVSSYVGRRLSEEVARQLGREELARMKPEEAHPDSYPDLVAKEK